MSTRHHTDAAETLTTAAPVSAASFSASTWAPLREPFFRAVWIAATASNIGTWMQSTAAAWMMTSLSASPVMVALMQTATSLPFFFLAVPAGALADIVDRRLVLLATQTWMLLAAGALGLLTIYGIVSPWILLGLTFALGLGAAVTAPAWQAIVPEMVAREDLPAAVALGGVSFNIARAVGPALAGLCLAALGTGPVYLLNAASFLALVAVLLPWRRAAQESSLPPEQLGGAMRAGVRYVRHSAHYRTVLVRSAAFMLPASALWALLPMVARVELSLNAVGYGLLLGCLGVGAIVGAWLLPRLRDALSIDDVLDVSALVFAAVTALLAFVHIVPLAAAAMFAGGVAWMAIMSLLSVAAQVAVPGWVRARALAINLLVVQGGLALGSLGWGALAEHTSTSTALWVGALAAVVSTAAVRGRGLQVLMNLDLTPGRHREPVVAGEIEPESGPVLVSVDYQIDPDDAERFVRAMKAIAPVRRRDGAIRWGLFRDAADPRRFVEVFIVTSWLEHLRQHQRGTVADHELLESARAFHVGHEPPRVTHLLSARALEAI